MFHVASIFDSGSSSGSSNTQSTAQSYLPQQVDMIGARTPGAGQSDGQEIEYPMEVTMPDRVTKVTITRDMAIRALKHMDDYTMPPEDATREDILAYRYLMWKDTENSGLRRRHSPGARQPQTSRVHDVRLFLSHHHQTRPQWCKEEEDAIGRDYIG